MVKKMNVTYDNVVEGGSEGVNIGNASNYISKFKKIDSVGGNYTEEDASPTREVTFETPPENYDSNTEVDILKYYYGRMGDGSGGDLEKVSGKIASTLNRLYKKTFSPAEILSKLQHLEFKDFKRKVTPRDVRSEQKTKLSLSEGSYSYIKGLPPLTGEYLDLVSFIPSEKICISSDDYSLYISLHPKHMDAFDNLFDFSANEELVFSMFKEQLGDEMKAKKMVLMTRLVSSSEPKKKRKK